LSLVAVAVSSSVSSFEFRGLHLFFILTLYFWPGTGPRGIPIGLAGFRFTSVLHPLHVHIFCFYCAILFSQNIKIGTLKMRIMGRYSYSVVSSVLITLSVLVLFLQSNGCYAFSSTASKGSAASPFQKKNIAVVGSGGYLVRPSLNQSPIAK
jgi:hypothetical protein